MFSPLVVEAEGRLYDVNCAWYLVDASRFAMAEAKWTNRVIH
jgi:hypothetical protein